MRGVKLTADQHAPFGCKKKREKGSVKKEKKREGRKLDASLRCAYDLDGGRNQVSPCGGKKKGEKKRGRGEGEKLCFTRRARAWRGREEGKRRLGKKKRGRGGSSETC